MHSYATSWPLQPFLSARCKFSWSPELDDAFQASKDAIVQSHPPGTAAAPSGAPDCCPNGWRIALAGSRFLSSAEQRYAAIEGEALAVAWGLEQTRYFTQGCDNLIVITDHKPLVKIFGDRTLDEITNSRLFRLKQRTLPWRFDTLHMPGKSNQAARLPPRGHPLTVWFCEQRLSWSTQCTRPRRVSADGRNPH
ncbi:hypothetical protein QZH41_002472 [Actinostola sp. cb2023]|nr:hypothetical protein QZH41_002472 [Actinostola sp. cb2023]